MLARFRKLTRISVAITVGLIIVFRLGTLLGPGVGIILSLGAGLVVLMFYGWAGEEEAHLSRVEQPRRVPARESSRKFILAESQNQHAPHNAPRT